MQKSDNQTNEAKSLPNRHSLGRTLHLNILLAGSKNQLWNYEPTKILDQQEQVWQVSLDKKKHKKTGFEVSELVVGSSEQDRKCKRPECDFPWVSNPWNLVSFGLAHLQLVGSAQEKSHHFAPEALI